MPKDKHNMAAEHHEKAAKSHRAAAEHHGKGDHEAGHRHSTEAQKHSETAHKHSQEAHNKSIEANQKISDPSFGYRAVTCNVGGTSRLRFLGSLKPNQITHMRVGTTDYCLAPRVAQTTHKTQYGMPRSTEA